MTTDGNQHDASSLPTGTPPSRTVTAGGVTYAYRELGPKGGIPVVFFVHLAATLDNWDPRIIDPIAQQHHVIAFDNRGVGASTGTVPDTVEAMADDAYAFITALGFATDRHPLLLPRRDGRPGIGAQTPRTRPQADPHRNRARRRQGHRQGRRHNLLRHAARHPHPRGPQGVPVLQPRRHRQSAPPAHSSNVSRNAPTTGTRKISIKAFRTQLKAIKRWGRSTPADLSVITQPTLIANGDNDRMVPVRALR